MERNDKIEFTKEGLEKVCQALTMLPQESRQAMVIGTIQAVIRA